MKEFALLGSAPTELRPDGGVEKNHFHGKFRADIEGLRSIAIVPVVLFHAGFAEFGVFRGGFVGVDVFFVVSGFLISNGIYRDFFVNQNYSILDFYGRRIRRIFPAIFVMYFACLILGALVVLPGDLAEISRSTIYSVGFVSNIYFASKSGYFDRGLEGNPLLHTWSLSVEEQFYIVLPLLLYLTRVFSHRTRLAILIAVFALSLGYAEALVVTSPSSAYYDFFARAWELMGGALLAIIAPRAIGQRLNNAVALGGLAMVMFAVFGFSKDTPFPGLAALVPCLGTIAIIYTGGNGRTPVGRLLEIPVMRFFGKISYSLYLWHWPLIVFWKLSVSTSILGMGIVVPASVAMATLSWRFVEQPIRMTRLPIGRATLLLGGACAMVAAVVATIPAQAINSRLFPETPRAARIERFVAEYQPNVLMREGVCFTSSKFNDIKYYQRDFCLHFQANKANVLLVGDSHSAQYWGAINLAFPGANIMQASSSGCLFGHHPMGEARCQALWDLLIREFLPRHKVDAIVLGELWRPGQEGEAVTLAQALIPFARELYIVGPNPSYSQKLPRILLMSEYGGRGEVGRLDRKIDARIDMNLGRQTYPAHTHYLSYYQAMCSPACPVWASDGNPAMFDENHLTRAAAVDVVRHWIGNGRFVTSGSAGAR